MISCCPCSVRLVEDKDFPRLEEIYLKHEGKTIPFGYFEDFKNSIRNENSLYFVAETDGVVVGGGGLELRYPDASILFFGLVDFEHCRKGLGTTLLVTRLFFLANSGIRRDIVIQATENSFPFFQRLGFTFYAEETDENENLFCWGESFVISKDKDRFRHLLRSANVHLADEILEPPQFVGFGRLDE